MIPVAGVLMSLIFFSLSALHLYWGLGGKTIGSSAVPSTESGKAVLAPGMITCFIVATGLFAFGMMALIKASLVPFSLPRWLTDYGLWAISAIFLLRAVGEFRYVGFFKRVKDTRFGRMDTLYYSPLALFIALLGILLQLLSSRV